VADLGKQFWRWTGLRGYSQRSAPQTMPDDMAQRAWDIQLEPGTLGRRRRSLVAIDLTGGPTTPINYLAVYRPRDPALSPQLWAFSGTALLAAHSRLGTTWTAHALSDAGVIPAIVCAVQFNNKLFVAYDSNVNRLHVYDGTSIRRVGLGQQGVAPTVANTGAGAYPATARFYRTQWLIKNGSDVQAMSELSPAVSFTPSGAGLAARVTVAPAAIGDQPTHWRLYGLLGTLGDTYDLYEQVGSDTVVATTFIDDTTNPANYSGAQPTAQGTNVPWPSVKYLTTDGNRLLGAGVWETTAVAWETTPKPNRVYFSRVLGSSDLGDDESIPNTTDQANWIDVGEDSEAITGLSEPVDGVVFVFQGHHMHALVPTGIDTLPYKEELVSAQIGLAPDPTAHRTITAVAGVVYFDTPNGLYRFSPTGGLAQAGWDLTTEFGGGFGYGGAAWDDFQQQLVLIRPGIRELNVYSPTFASQTPQGLRGGWVQWFPMGFSTVDAIVPFESTGASDPRWVVLAGLDTGGTTPLLHVFSTTAVSDVGGSYQPEVISHAHVVGLNMSAYAPLLEVTVQLAADVVPQLSYRLDWTREIRGPVSAPSLLTVGFASRLAVRVDGLEASDAYALQVWLVWHASQTGTVDAVTVPLHPQEPR
jgi:hypothetical protein